MPSLPFALHASHWPVQAFEQQKPSTQVPERHSAAVLQLMPFGSFATHTPPAQYCVLLQSPSEMHESAVPLQRAPTQLAPFGHGSTVAGGQLPAPSQKAASVALPFWQRPSRHETPGPGYVHDRVVLPSQTPPQSVPAPAQPGRPCAGGCPSAMGVHVPIATDWAHASH